MIKTMAKLSLTIAASTTIALFVLIAFGLPVTDELRFYAVVMSIAASWSAYLAYR